MPYVAPTTRTTGEFIDTPDWNQDVVDNQNAAFPLGVAGWTTYTPTLTQSGAVTKTVTYAKYQRIGRLIVVAFRLDVTGTGTAANVVVVGLPVTAAVGSFLPVGSAFIADVSTGINHPGLVVLADTATFQFIRSDGSGTLGAAGFSAALATGDVVTGFATYEAAS